MDKKRLLIISTAVLLAIVAIVLVHSSQSAPPESQSAPYTGNAKVPEGSLQPAGSVFVGYDSLFDIGVTADQINGLQAAFQRYKPTAGSGAEVSLDSSSIVSYAPSPRDPLYRPSVVAKVVINGKTTYKVTFYYWGTSTVQLLIYDQGGQHLLFDSKKVDGSN